MKWILTILFFKSVLVFSQNNYKVFCESGISPWEAKYVMIEQNKSIMSVGGYFRSYREYNKDTLNLNQKYSNYKTEVTFLNFEKQKKTIKFIYTKDSLNSKKLFSLDYSNHSILKDSIEIEAKDSFGNKVNNFSVFKKINDSIFAKLKSSNGKILISRNDSIFINSNGEFTCLSNIKSNHIQIIFNVHIELVSYLSLVNNITNIDYIQIHRLENDKIIPRGKYFFHECNERMAIPKN